MDRRALLSTTAVVGVSSLAGCIGMFSTDDENEQQPIQVGRIGFYNSTDEPHTVTIGLTSHEMGLLFLGTRELTAEGNEEGEDEVILEGPWPTEKALLSAFVIVDGDFERGVVPERDDGVMHRKLGFDDEIPFADESDCIQLLGGVSGVLGQPNISLRDGEGLC